MAYSIWTFLHKLNLFNKDMGRYNSLVNPCIDAQHFPFDTAILRTIFYVTLSNPKNFYLSGETIAP